MENKIKIENKGRIESCKPMPALFKNKKQSDCTFSCRDIQNHKLAQAVQLRGKVKMNWFEVRAAIF